MSQRPNILFVMTDQQRFDTIRALGNEHIYTPNMDRLVRRGLSFTQAYSPCPVCVAARYTIRTGCTPLSTRVFSNGQIPPAPEQADTMTGRCGPYLAQTMQDRGYRTFGIGKFHTTPRDEDLGYEVHLHSEELYGNAEGREKDAYASYIKTEHPHFDFIEGLMGERTEMYYMPQMSGVPAELGVEAWAADRAVEQVGAAGERPFFGFVSFIGPHPPLAPPIPFNRMYDPDRMPNPVRGQLATDHMDEQIPWMNHAIWAEDITDAHARVLKARYYGELTYIDQCLGRILDAVEARPDSDNTLICFFADHGDHMGDHTAWQKESFFDVSCRVPFLVSWPARLAKDQRREELVGLHDLFALATGAAGSVEAREGIDVLGTVVGSVAPREHLIGLYGAPGTSQFKVMVRGQRWKYIFFANGGGEQLFDSQTDPHEVDNKAADQPDMVRALRQVAIAALDNAAGDDALERGDLRAFPFAARDAMRIYQFDRSRGIVGFPERPEDVLQ
ncbi:MAG: sulfatase-like hydrolase/transferase [Candidatus Latescibacteria bacterium]|nr:sulfatase-like hydrolase/transferase [Candidatus Latescibacterota bacterium]